MQMDAGVMLMRGPASMIYFARSLDGNPRPFLQNWLLCQLYPLLCMLVATLGFAAILLGWLAPT